MASGNTGGASGPGVGSGSGSGNDSGSGGGSGSGQRNLPPPPPVPPGVTPSNIADAQKSSAGQEPAMKRPRPNPPMVYHLMKRPGFGTKGNKVDLICNHFKVSFRPSEPVNQYCVEVEPAVKSNVNRMVMAGLKATYGEEFLRGKHYAYDGEKSLFVVGSLNTKKSEFPVLLDGGGSGGRGRPREFVVRINHSTTIDMRTIDAVLRGERNDKAQEALRVLDIMLREHAAKKNFMLQKDSFFHPSLGQVKDLGDGAVVWRGYHLSVKPTMGGLSLNFDLSVAVVIDPIGVMEFLNKQIKCGVVRFQREDWMKAKRLLKGVMVNTYAGRKHKIIGFSPQPCSKQTFPLRIRNSEGTNPESQCEVTVADYFAKERKMTLKYPQLPALDCGKANKPVYLPMEFCTIVEGQKYRKSLTSMQRKTQLDSTRQNPGERCRDVMKALQASNFNADELVKEFNVKIEQKMKEVPGRVLETPKLLFGNGRSECPRGGRWDYRDKAMITPLPIPNWGVAVFRGRFPCNAKKIADDMKHVCGLRGMKLGNYVLIEEDTRDRNLPNEKRVQIVADKLVNELGKFAQNQDPVQRPFVLAMLPEKSPDLYVPFKRLFEVQIGYVTQCMVPPKVCDPKYLTSVSLKMNLKRGGYNSVLDHEDSKRFPKISQRPTIVIGLDVSHGSPGDSSAPSVAAAVGTVGWPRMSQFSTSIRAQPPKVEMIQGLYESNSGGMVKELLVNFFKHGKGTKPEQILIFRDGVSESQFDQVLENELVAVKQACLSMQKEYKPRITVVIVQKRHHTRFFTAKGMANVAPGTIVDKDPCHPGNFDFYLCSHFGAIGTSRPTHYHVLYDEIGFTADELQMVTHSLCYSYTRCTSAVSVVAPAYYAHLAAQHCRNLIQENWDSGSESSVMSDRIARANNALPKLKDHIMKSMFYA